MRGGKVVEVESQVELDYLKGLTNQSYWLGATRNTQSGLWQWEFTRENVNFAPWTIENGNYGYANHTIAVSNGSIFKPLLDQSHEAVDVICEVPSRFAS